MFLSPFLPPFPSLKINKILLKTHTHKYYFHFNHFLKHLYRNQSFNVFLKVHMGLNLNWLSDIPAALPHWKRHRGIQKILKREENGK